jgi:hypothetical protein
MTVHTITKPTQPKDEETPKPGVRCAAMMTIGTRGKFGDQGLKRKSYSVRKGQKRQCPLAATRTVNGTPYCKMHGPHHA